MEMTNSYLSLVPNIIGLVLLLFLVASLLVLILNILRRVLSGKSYSDHQVFLVKLPKEKPEDAQKGFSLAEIKEEIARGETVFSSIGGLRAEKGFKAWLFGRRDIFSFEIVANQQRIAFYVTATKHHVRYLEQQIQAYYPEAVIEPIEDYNIFSPQSCTAAAFLKTKKQSFFPLKTYQKMEVDPLNSLINSLSKLDKDESIALQYLVRSARASWHKKSQEVVRAINKSGSVSAGLKSNNPFRRFDKIFKIINPPKKTDKPNLEEPKQLSAVESEMVKAIEEKNLKTGLDVNLRIIVNTQSIENSNRYLENIASHFAEYNNYTYGNNFSRARRGRSNRLISDFIYRRFQEKQSFLLNSEELASIFHFPLKSTETPNILWLASKSAPAPSEVPSEGISLGNNIYRGVKKEIRIKRADRRRHTYIVGKSGVGKSVLLANMIIQDVQAGEGVCVFDPNGDLIQDVLDRIPPERAEDVIIFSPGDLERPLALNLLEYDENYPEQRSFVINEMISILDKLYDLKATGGPMFEQYMRNAMLLVMDDPESGATLMEIPKVLADEDFRRYKLSRCSNQTVVDFWHKEAEKAGGEAALANIVPYITSKLTPFISNDMMRPIIGQQKSAFNIRELMDQQKILLVDLPKGTIGETNANLLGMILVGKILIAALSRTDMDPDKRKDFYLYIDEFQNFTTNSICQILSEARKYALNLIIAHQYIGQLSKNNDTAIKDAVFGNVGTMISFKVGSEDAEFLVKEFSPVFNQFDLINVDKFVANVKLLVDNTSLRPFSLNTTWPLLGVKREGIREKIRTLSRLKYGQSRQLVEADISQRAKEANKQLKK